MLAERRLAEVLAGKLAPYAERNLIQGVPVGWGAAAWHVARLLRVAGDVEGAHRYAAIAQGLHRRWGAGAWDPPLTGLDGPTDPRRALSGREREVLALLAAGRANREIATTLHLSVHTVERHVANISGKLGTRNRAEATAWAHHSGMVG